MKRSLFVLAIIACGIIQPLGGTAIAENWPQFRGPTGDGVSREKDAPLRWSETENIVWKCPVPDGASVPAIWGDDVFVTAQDKDKLILIRIGKNDGKIAWMREVGTAPAEREKRMRAPARERREQRFHQLHNRASPSPATDGEVVVAHFGNGDLAAFDFAGKKLWTRNLQKEHGPYTMWWGHANSPVLYQDVVINVCMQDSLSDLPVQKVDSYVVAHDKRTGEQRWKTMRATGAMSEAETRTRRRFLFRPKRGRNS